MEITIFGNRDIWIVTNDHFLPGKQLCLPSTEEQFWEKLDAIDDLSVCTTILSSLNSVQQGESYNTCST